jgi:hypothetical protein
LEPRLFFFDIGSSFLSYDDNTCNRKVSEQQLMIERRSFNKYITDSKEYIQEYIQEKKDGITSSSKVNRAARTEIIFRYTFLGFPHIHKLAVTKL